MIHAILPVGMLQCNCSILGDEASREAIVIDPGDEIDQILKILAQHGLRVKAIVITHAHIDHIGGAQKLKAATGAPVYMNENDTPLYDALDTQAGWLGIPTPECTQIDTPLHDGDSLRLGPAELHTLHTPGHTQGSVSLWIPLENKLIAGDTLFRDSIGRTDLPGGDGRQILRSIHEKLCRCPTMRSSFRGMGPTPPLGAKSDSTLFCGISNFQFRHHTGDQLFGVADRLADDLDIHGGLPRGPGTLAIDAVLTYQHKRVGENIERNGKLAARFSHHEFVLFQFVAAVFEYAHGASLGYRVS